MSDTHAATNTPNPSTTPERSQPSSHATVSVRNNYSSRGCRTCTGGFINSYHSTLQNDHFFVDWENSSIGTVTRDGKRHSHGDFAVKLTCMVEAASHTGYLAEVKIFDGQQRYYNTVR